MCAEGRGAQPHRVVQGPRHDHGDRRRRSRTAPRSSICASTGNTSASAAAYAARAGIIVRGGASPRGRSRSASSRRRSSTARRSCRSAATSTHALDIVRELGERAGVDGRQLDQPVPHRGAEDRRRSRSSTRSATRPTCTASRSATPATSPRTGRATASTTAPGAPRARPRMLGWQAAGAAPIVRGEPVPHPETIATAIRIGNPASWDGAIAARDESGGAHRRGDRRRDPRRPTACWPRPRRVLRRAGVGGVGRRACSRPRRTGWSSRASASCARSPATA